MGMNSNEQLLLSNFYLIIAIIVRIYWKKRPFEKNIARHRKHYEGNIINSEAFYLEVEGLEFGGENISLISRLVEIVRWLLEEFWWIGFLLDLSSWH